MEKAKKLMPIDALIARYLRDGIDEAGLTYRRLAEVTGMSINRIGIILRQEPPPATVGEIGMLAGTFGASASTLVSRATDELDDSNVVEVRFGREPNDHLAVARESDEEPTDEQ